MDPKFKLDTTPLENARAQMTAVESLAPNAQLVRGEVDKLLASATKANRALIAADSAQSLLAYHASKLEQQMELMLESGNSASFPPEERERLLKTLRHTQTRLYRTEAYARGCRDMYLAKMEQQIRQLEALDDDGLVVQFQ